MQNRINASQNQHLYKPRQAIVEHPGVYPAICGSTIKRQWGFNYILSKKGIARASADVGLMLTVYNLRRLINILGIKELFKVLEINVMRVLAFFRTIQAKLSHIFAVTASLDFPVKINKYLFFTFIFEKKLEF